MRSSPRAMLCEAFVLTEPGSRCMDGDMSMFHGLRRDPRGRRDSAGTFSSRLRNQDLDRSVHVPWP